MTGEAVRQPETHTVWVSEEQRIASFHAVEGCAAQNRKTQLVSVGKTGWQMAKAAVDVLARADGGGCKLRAFFDSLSMYLLHCRLGH